MMQFGPIPDSDGALWWQAFFIQMWWRQNDPICWCV